MSSSVFPPELFPLIASFIPLRSAQRTLLSLAFGNRRFYDIVRPLLYSRLVLGNEDDAIAVIQRLLAEPQLGIAVTELYILADLSVEAREGKKPFDVVDGLQMLIKKKVLPRLVALGIHLGKDWTYDDNWNQIPSHGRLLLDFWSTLRMECPRLQSLSLRNVGHGFGDPYLTGPVIDEIIGIPGLSTLRLEWGDIGLAAADGPRVIDGLSQLATTLHTLSLQTNFAKVEPILSMDFPNLVWLRLDRFSTERSTTSFFRRHPQLEKISLVRCIDNWFSDDVDETLLPNLRHLEATFNDIRFLTPILPRLVSLSFTESRNCQVPYLLRSVIPTGLPGLKSLEIAQSIAAWEERHLNEGILWYETSDGRFRLEKNKIKVMRHFINDYIHSIVRGAPNLEELGLHGMYLDSEVLAKFGPTLAQLVHMKRFYYNGFSTCPTSDDIPPQDEHDGLISEFLSSAEDLARLCPNLEKVTSIGGKYLPYLSGLIARNSVGKVTGVKRSYGVGMELSAQDNDPFPYNT